ncbi:MAG TPA: SLOG family protein [Chloroflexaceae bacterium]|nr:SLOG family protein [Chloroflexaceae bacterium]
MIVIIAGSRAFTNLALVRTAVQASGWRQHILKIVSGGARGIDSLAERFAHEQAIPVEVVRADWTDITVPGAVIRSNARGAYNAAAGMQRNLVMARRALDAARELQCGVGLILIWDGKSSGSAQMRRVALSHQFRVFEHIPPATA